MLYKIIGVDKNMTDIKENYGKPFRCRKCGYTWLGTDIKSCPVCHSKDKVVCDISEV